MKTIAVWGGTGLIGRELVKSLSGQYKIIIISRNPDKAQSLFDSNVMVSNDFPKSSPDIIINLAGENIGGKKWSEKQKQKILESRVSTSEKIINYINGLSKKPELYIQASAIGYYGNSLDKSFTEESEKGSGFLAEVCYAWETPLSKLNPNLRSAVIRTGVVLRKKGGMLKQLLLPFKLFVGGHVGNGKQWISWIHMDDEIRAIKFIIENPNLSGVFNLCSPEAVNFKEFAKTMGNVLGRPSWLPVPSFVIKNIFRQMGKEMILQGQKVTPNRLKVSNFEFQYLTLEKALKNLLQK